MPRREDEYWASEKEGRGRGLCPFCGRSNIYYNEHYRSWRCGNCEKSFPSPAYGPGKDFGKEARLSGQTTEVKRAEFAELARKARARKAQHPRRRGRSGGLPGWFIPTVIIVLLGMFGTVAWGLWGAEITEFFNSISTSPVQVSESPPVEAATPSNLSGTTEAKQVAEINISELERQIHNLVNAERKGRGLSPLTWDSELNAIARKHSEDMATRHYFGHTSPEGLEPIDRYQREGFVVRQIPAGGNHYYLGCSENIYQCSLIKRTWYLSGIPTHSEYYSEEEIALLAVQGWMDSPGHRENIVTPYWESEGIGVAISSDGEVYITQNFG